MVLESREGMNGCLAVGLNQGVLDRMEGNTSTLTEIS